MNLENVDHLDLPDQVVQWDPEDPADLLESQADLVTWAFPVGMAFLVLLDLLGLKDPPDLLVHLDQEEEPDHQEKEDPEDHKRGLLDL